MRESAHGTLRGVCGPVANLVKTDDRYTVALETALGGAMQNIVVETQEDGKAAIELLKRRESGRATFLPVAVIRGYELKERPQNEAGYLGTALELARFDQKYRDIFANLLGRTVVCESLADAVAMSKRHNNQLRIVTLDGQLINAGGSMILGEGGEKMSKSRGNVVNPNDVVAQYGADTLRLYIMRIGFALREVMPSTARLSIFFSGYLLSPATRSPRS